MSSLSQRRVGLLGLVAAFAAIIVAVALASTSDAASKSSKVTLSEFKISASPKTASAGKVTFNVKNAGDMEHEMVVIKTSTAASKLKVGSYNRVGEKGAVGEVEDLAGGKSKKLTL